MMGVAGIVAALSLAAGAAPMVRAPAASASQHATWSEGPQLLYDDPVADRPESPVPARRSEPKRAAGEQSASGVRSFPVIHAMLQAAKPGDGSPIAPAVPGEPETPAGPPLPRRPATANGPPTPVEPGEPAKLPPTTRASPFAPDDDSPPAKKPPAPSKPLLLPAEKPLPAVKPLTPKRDPAYDNGPTKGKPEPIAPKARAPLDEPGQLEYGAGCAAGCDAYCDACTPWYSRQRMHDWLWGICYEGWLSQGLTFNGESPRNGSNYPVTFNDRSNDYQLNQLYFVLVREVEKSDGWDLGGRIDFLYGTDWPYVASRGLEADRDFSPKWNAGRYGLAMPQCYAEVYLPWPTGIGLKLGHFYSILGYESAMAPENFFYSHSYLRQYAEPFTHTGLLGSTSIGGLTLQLGMTRGWDNWEDNNNDLGVLAGLSWKSPSGATTVSFGIHSGREQDEPPGNSANRTAYSLVWQQRLSRRLQYVVQHDWGFDAGAAPPGLGGASWFGLNQYFLYTFNERWKAGLRFEWFRDDEGARIAAHPLRGADYYEASLGVNFTPGPRVALRPEVRWDWVQAPGYTPFADNTRSSQFLFACDLILRF